MQISLRFKHQSQTLKYGHNYLSVDEFDVLWTLGITVTSTTAQIQSQ